MAKKVFIVWDNFGPMHMDRLAAAQQLVPNTLPVNGVEIYGRSGEYDWEVKGKNLAAIETLFAGGEAPTLLRRVRRLLGAFSDAPRSYIFLCNYDRLEIIIVSLLARLMGHKVFLMSCSKYDDYERNAVKEALKRLALLPYKGVISAGGRAAEYLRFLGFRADRITGGYNTLSISRIRELAQTKTTRTGCGDYLLVIARLVPKKNLSMLLTAYKIYVDQYAGTLPLRICGSGPLLRVLQDQALALGIQDRVEFMGFVQAEGIAAQLADAKMLLLPSVEEQFGNVVMEAFALNVPVITSSVCGANDELVRSGINGFVVEPDNPKGWAYFIHALDSDPNLWQSFSQATFQSFEKIDAKRFGEGVLQLINSTSRN